MKALLPSALLSLLAGACGAPPEGELLVAAASSLRDVLEATRADFEGRVPGARLRFSFAASSTLARQIAAGADYDAFLSADEASVERVAARLDERRAFLSNRLVLVVGADDLLGASPESAASPDGDLARGVERVLARAGDRDVVVAVAAEAVPAGRYARELLEDHGLLAALAPRFVLGGDVRKTLALVESGAADCGFVYRSDACASARTRVLWTQPAGTSPAIRYVAAPLADARPEAAGFVRWLAEAEFQEAAEALGFAPLAP